MSQQALREAFSEAELLAAKKKHQQVQEHMQVRPHSQAVTAGMFLQKHCCNILVKYAIFFADNGFIR